MCLYIYFELHTGECTNVHRLAGILLVPITVHDFSTLLN